MVGLGQSIFEEGFEEGFKKGFAMGLKQATAQGIKRGIAGSVQILIEIGCSKEQIIDKIMEQYDLSRDTAETYLA